MKPGQNHSDFKAVVTRRMTPVSCQQGFGLLEVLIALLIVSIGFIGTAALQIVSLQNNNSAMSRSIATISSYSILDAMRADRTNALGGSYDVDTCTGSIGTGTSLPLNQLNIWQNEMQQHLGNAACGSVSCTAGTCTIIVQFDDSRATDGSTTHTVTTEVVL